MAAGATGAPVVFHEKQDSALCGQHCLNNLVQRPHFAPMQLARIAHELDARERELMLSMGTDTPDALRYLAGDSQHVDASGNFSIGVLRKALKSAFGLELSQSPEALLRAMREPGAFEGFVLHQDNHWYCLRRLHKHWFDLNSFNDRPVRIGELHMSALLAQLKQEGWTVFVVQGSLPAALMTSSLPQGCAAGIPPYHDLQELLRPARRAAGGASQEEADIARAIALSMQGSVAAETGGQRAGGGDEVDDGDEELRRALALSMADAPAEPTAVASGSGGGAVDSRPRADWGAARLGRAAAEPGGGQSPPEQ